jgi:hypothetical protein
LWYTINRTASKILAITRSSDNCTLVQKWEKKSEKICYQKAIADILILEISIVIRPT